MRRSRSAPGRLFKEIREPYFFGYVRDQLIRAYGVETVRSGGLRVYTTIQPTLQRLAQQAIRETLTEPDDPAAALISIDPSSGAIRAMAAVVPGRRDNQFNLLSQARRQPGSTFKTFVLAAAVEKRIDPDATYYVSAPFTYRPTRDGKLRGRKLVVREDLRLAPTRAGRSISRATLRSDNVVYAQLTLDVTPAAVASIARRLGVRTPLDVNGALRAGDGSRLDRGLAARHGVRLRDPRGRRRLLRADGDPPGGAARAAGRTRTPSGAPRAASACSRTASPRW